MRCSCEFRPKHSLSTVSEHPYMDWRAFPELVPCKNGWALPESSPQIQLNFSVVARQSKQR